MVSEIRRGGGGGLVLIGLKHVIHLYCSKMFNRVYLDLETILAPAECVLCKNQRRNLQVLVTRFW